MSVAGNASRRDTPRNDRFIPNLTIESTADKIVP